MVLSSDNNIKPEVDKPGESRKAEKAEKQYLERIVSCSDKVDMSGESRKVEKQSECSERMRIYI